jgi:hypothetical protein
MQHFETLTGRSLRKYLPNPLSFVTRSSGPVDVNASVQERSGNALWMTFVKIYFQTFTPGLVRAENFAPASVSVPQSSVRPTRTASVRSSRKKPVRCRPSHSSLKAKAHWPIQIDSYDRATQSGALEPFLVSTQSQTQTQPAMMSQHPRSRNHSRDSLNRLKLLHSRNLKCASQLIQSESQSICQLNTRLPSCNTE